MRSTDDRVDVVLPGRTRDGVQPPAVFGASLGVLSRELEQLSREVTQDQAAVAPSSHAP